MMASMTTPPLEDSFADILGKAARGQGLDPAAFEPLVSGTWDAARAQEACARLGLNFPALRDLAAGRWQPRAPILPRGLALFTTPFGDMAVNATLAWDPASRLAAAFDTGADCSALLRELEIRNLKLETLFLTHTHGDHVYEFDRLREKTGCRAFVCQLEPFEGAESFEPGRTFAVGGLHIESCLTSGHSPGGTTYHIHGLDAPVTITGDALFAGSVGGIKADYAASLAMIRREILGRQDHTLLCPGHGPMTTVAEEKRHNPFFA